MFLYNVTFLTHDWNITTTVRHNSESDDDVIRAASDFLFQTARLNVNDFHLIEVDVDYCGEET